MSLTIRKLSGGKKVSQRPVLIAVFVFLVLIGFVGFFKYADVFKNNYLIADTDDTTTNSKGQVDTNQGIVDPNFASKQVDSKAGKSDDQKTGTTGRRSLLSL